MNYNIAIDFGTCNTVISYNTDNQINHILDNISNDVLIPSTILFIKDEITLNLKVSELELNKHYIIGSSANNEYNNYNNDCYFYQFKRFLGITNKTNNDYLKQLNIKYKLDDEIIYLYIPTIDNDFIEISIVELIRLYFSGLDNLIKNTLNLHNNINIILTCPAYFHDLQRSQLKKALDNTNFKIYKIYNEPTTASIYYINKYNNTLDNQLIINNKFIVYDLGGGTIDTTVVEYHNDTKTCEILDIDGNNSLGGIDIDNLIIENIYSTYFIDKLNIKWIPKIRKCAEEIKIKLSYTTNYEIVLENVPINKNNKIRVEDILIIKYNRHLLNSLINKLVDEMIEPIVRMYKKYETNNIIFIGGPTQIPLIQNKVNAILNIESNNIILNSSLNLYKTIVADGASILYELLNTKSDFCLLDIIPMNIGISSPDNDMIIMIQKNSKIPTSVEKVFSTSHDCQRVINIDVYEGINDNCKNNNYIGSYKILGIPSLPRGSIIIKLLFKINYNGILNISINGFKNSSDESIVSFDFKLTEKIKLIPNIIAKELLKKLLTVKK